MDNSKRREGVSKELDALAAELLSGGLDRLAAGQDLNVLLAVEDAQGTVASYEFADDGPEQCLEAARSRVRELARDGADAQSGLAVPLRYALCYEAAIADDADTYQDALLLEFGERGWRSYSGYSLFKGRGTGENLTWTDPAPAGEIEPLL